MEPVPTASDATAEFYEAMNDPQRWIIKPGVPVFKPHERTDPATGQLIKVDLPKLYRIATNMQRLERTGGVPVRMTLGHTEPGKPETQQPPVGGYYRNARVAQFGPKGEPAIVVDEWLDPQYAQVRKNFPFRSAEYYDDAEQITGVALLTRDPYLDLGVVAYSRSGKNAVHYGRTIDKRPTMYHFLTGDAMATPNTAAQDVNGQPIPAPTGAAFNPAPIPAQTVQNPVTGQQQYAAETNVNPTPYGTTYSGPWPGPAYKKHNIGHQHPSGGAVYANQPRGANPVYGRGGSQRPTGNRPPGRYANYDDEMMGEEMPPMMEEGPGAGGDPLQTVHDCLVKAVEALSDMMGGGMAAGGVPPAGGPPESPFPPEEEEVVEEEEGPPLNSSRYAGYQPRPRTRSRYSNSVPYGTPEENRRAFNEAAAADRKARHEAEEARRAHNMRTASGDPFKPTTSDKGGYLGRADKYSHYSRQGQPMHQNQRTISGQPVGYQLTVDRLQYQLNQANEALRVLYYERDQSDTAWCEAEIRRLASLGYDVGEYEIVELKNKPREHRAAYLQHIATKYQRVPVGEAPILMGDPSPAVAPQDQNRPLSREEMDLALKISNQRGIDFSEAMQYARGGQNPTQYGGRLGAVSPEQAAWTEGEPAPEAFGDPYPEHGMNGQPRF